MTGLPFFVPRQQFQDSTGVSRSSQAGNFMSGLASLKAGTLEARTIPGHRGQRSRSLSL